MGLDTLVTRANGQIIDADHINLFNRVLEGTFVGRDATGAPTANQDFGTITIPWGTGRFTNLILGGSSIDPSLITAPPNRIVSGAIRATSNFPDYIRPAGAGNGAEFTVRATATDLVIDVNGAETTYDTDIVKGSLTVAPAANNTCRINDTGLTGQQLSKNLGEDETTIIVDTMGTEITSKIGNYVALLNQTTNEIMYAFVKSSTLLTTVRRGFFLNSSANPIVRAVLNNNDILQILSLAFIFADEDGATIDVSYRNPVKNGTAPTSPQTGDYWYDLAVDKWKRYGGVSFDIIDRTFAGYAVLDGTDCIGARPEYFTKSYTNENTVETNLESVDVIVSKRPDSLISVDGIEIFFDFSFFRWSAGTDFESGVSRTTSRNYYLYISEKGRPVISDKKPYDERGFLKGWYHPYDSWRFVDQVYNNSGDEFELVARPNQTTAADWSAENLVIGGLTNTTVDVDADVIELTDEDNLTIIIEDLDLTLDITASGAGGLDTGSEATSTLYYIWVISQGNGQYSGLLSVSSTAPTVPFGYTLYNVIGSVYNNSAGHFYEIKYLREDQKRLVEAWLNFNGTGTPAIRESFNILSITDNGTGDFTINFTTAMPDANYVVVGNAKENDSVTNDASERILIFPITRTTSGFNYRTSEAAGATLRDCVINDMIIMR